MLLQYRYIMSSRTNLPDKLPHAPDKNTFQNLPDLTLSSNIPLNHSPRETFIRQTPRTKNNSDKAHNPNLSKKSQSISP